MTVSRGKITKRSWTWEGKKRVAYAFDVLVGGKRVRKQYSTRQEALDALEEYRADVKNPKPAATEVPTFGAVVDRFLAQRVNRKTAGEFARGRPPQGRARRGRADHGHHVDEDLRVQG